MVERVRRTEVVDFLGRECMMYEPADTQKAMLAQLAKSTRVDTVTKVSRIVDLLEAWFVVESDRVWFADQMLEGVWDFEEDVLVQINTVIDAFAPKPANRAEARKATKKAVRKAVTR